MQATVHAESSSDSPALHNDPVRCIRLKTLATRPPESPANSTPGFPAVSREGIGKLALGLSRCSTSQSQYAQKIPCAVRHWDWSSRAHFVDSQCSPDLFPLSQPAAFLHAVASIYAPCPDCKRRPGARQSRPSPFLHRSPERTCWGRRRDHTTCYNQNRSTADDQWRDTAEPAAERHFIQMRQRKNPAPPKARQPNPVYHVPADSDGRRSNRPG